jgi:hypothetical protein
MCNGSEPSILDGLHGGNSRDWLIVSTTPDMDQEMKFRKIWSWWERIGGWHEESMMG